MTDLLSIHSNCDVSYTCNQCHQQKPISAANNKSIISAVTITVVNIQQGQIQEFEKWGFSFSIYVPIPPFLRLTFPSFLFYTIPSLSSFLSPFSALKH